MTVTSSRKLDESVVLLDDYDCIVWFYFDYAFDVAA